MDNEIKSMPMVPLRGMTIMPGMVVHFDVSRARSIAAVQEAMVEEQKIFLTAQRSIDTEDPGMGDVYEIGTVGTVKQIIKLPKQIVRVLVSGESRGRLKEVEFSEPYLRAKVEVMKEPEQDLPEDANTEAMERSLKDMLVEYASKNGKMSKESVARLMEIKGLQKLVDEIAANIPLYYTDQQDILKETDLKKRYDKLAFKLVNEVQIMNIKDEIQRKVKERVDKHQREYILREQLKLIREELGEEFVLTKGLDGCLSIYPKDEWKNFEEKLKALPLNDKNARAFLRFFVASATMCELDRQGRILVPQTLREFAGLIKDVVLTGNLTRIEVWSKEKWLENSNYEDMDAIAQGMQDMGIVI